jgi:hypothetical protein
MHMPNILRKLLRKEYIFRRVLTFSVNEWRTLSVKLEPDWKILERQRLSKKSRTNKIGQGRPYALGGFDSILFAVILYLRTNIGYELLALLLEVDANVLKRVVSRVSPLLIDRFMPNSVLIKKRTNNLDEFLKGYPELKDVIFDGSEFPILRPKRRQKQSYSGKKKRHTKKIQIGSERRGKQNLVVAVSDIAKGRMHDKKQIEKTMWDKKLPKDVKRRGDSGYQGMTGWITPKKKPKGRRLSKQARRRNKKLAKERIYVEHAIRGVKIFRRIGEIVKIKSDEKLQSIILACANLHNFKELARQSA